MARTHKIMDEEMAEIITTTGTIIEEIVTRTEHGAPEKKMKGMMITSILFICM